LLTIFEGIDLQKEMNPAMSLYCFFTSTFFRRIVLLAWILTILWLSLDPAPPVPEPKILGWDKLLHAFAYGSLTLFGGWALSGSSPLSKAKWGAVACAAIALGGLVELLQKTFTDTRIAEFGDFLANAFGAAIVLLGVFGFRKYKRRQSKHLVK
jgi:VanZ family protein